jgi:hypothetical protein
MFFKKIVGVYFDIHNKFVNTQRGNNALFLNVKINYPLDIFENALFFLYNIVMLDIVNFYRYIQILRARIAQSV